MFDYTVNSNHSTEKTIERLKTALAEVSFGVLLEFDLAKKFAEKELPFEDRYHILEVCNPKEAHRVCRRNVGPATFYRVSSLFIRKMDRRKSECRVQRH